MIPGMPTINASHVNFSQVDRVKDLKVAKTGGLQNKENGSSNVSHAVPLKKPSKYVTVRGLGADPLEAGSFDKRGQPKNQH